MNRAMLGRMVMRAGAARLPAGTALMAVAGSLTEASAAVAAGADLIDLGAATPGEITAFRARHPGIPVCAAGSPADVVRDATVARVTGALLLCTDAGAAAGGEIPADQVLVDCLPASVPVISQAGLAALVDADRAAGLAAQHHVADHLADSPTGTGHTASSRAGNGRAGNSGAGNSGAGNSGAGNSGADGEPREIGLTPIAGILAIAALSSWLGARAVRTRYPLQVRRVLDMTASVLGTRPPVRAIRGLA